MRVILSMVGSVQRPEGNGQRDEENVSGRKMHL